MTTWVEDIDSEDLGEASWDGEAVDEGIDDSEASRWDVDRRERARRLALARRRALAARGRPVVRRTITPRETVAAIRELDLQTKVSADSQRLLVERANKRASRATYATIAALAVDQALDTFGDDLADHDFVRAGLRSLPLALLSPERKRRGFEGVVLDPRVLGLAGVVTIVTAGRLSHRGTGVVDIAVLQNQVSGDGQLTGLALDRNGNVLSVPVTYRSQNTNILSVDPDGTFRAKEEGTVFVIATAGGHSSAFTIEVG